MEKVDQRGIRVLDRVIGFRNAAVLTIFLKKGAKLGPATWIMAEGKPKIQLILLNKLLEDGNTLYRKNMLPEAAHRYRYAIHRLPTHTSLEPIGDSMCSQAFAQLELHLLLNLSRCERRQGRQQEAIQLASQAIISLELLQAGTAGMVEALVARAKACRAADRVQEAIQDFRMALEIEPGNRDIVQALSRLREDIISDNHLVKIPGGKMGRLNDFSEKRAFIDETQTKAESI